MLPRSVFYHIPKTGGMWVRRAIATAGIPATEWWKASEYHETFRSAPAHGKFTFTFVRNPQTWYPSFWSHRMRRGWRMEDVLDPYMSLDFDIFMKNVLKYLPGQLTKRYERYIGPEPGSLDFVGRQETLAEDLIRALRMAGEEFDEDKILNTPRENAGNNLPAYSDQLLDAVLESESGAMTRFGWRTRTANAALT